MLLRNEEDARAFVAARCSAPAFSKLEHFCTMLRRESASQNLVAKATLQSIWLRHLADSAQLLDHVSRETSPWLDLGSGAGFPGLVIAVMRPERTVHLVESRNLRIQWLNRMISALNLTNCRVHGRDLRRVVTIEAAVISARAFAPLSRLIELSARFSTNATEWVLPKGRSAAHEVSLAPSDVRARFHVKQSVTDGEAGIIVGCGKIS